MKVFVTGSTGVIGRRVVRLLVAAGHEVTAAVRSGEKAAFIRSLDATPVVVDIFDTDEVYDAMHGHEAVCNLATHVPPLTRAALPGATEENNRIRREGSAIVVDAAIAAGASCFIQESLGFVYADRGADWIHEDTPLELVPNVAAVADAEANTARFTESGGRGIVLRFGNFHAFDSDHTAGYVNAARHGFAILIGPPDAYVPVIHVDDAATAVVAALGAPAGVYNVVDDPVTRSEYNAILAAAVGRERLRNLTRAVTVLGGASARMIGRSQRVSNQKLRDATGWAPSYPSARETWPAVIAEMERKT